MPVSVVFRNQILKLSPWDEPLSTAFSKYNNIKKTKKKTSWNLISHWHYLESKNNPLNEATCLVISAHTPAERERLIKSRVGLFYFIDPTTIKQWRQSENVDQKVTSVQKQTVCLSYSFKNWKCRCVTHNDKTRVKNNTRMFHWACLHQQTIT